MNISGKRSINLSSFTMEAGLTDGEPDRILILPYSEVAEGEETML